jgi:hypothetical protein
LFIRQPFALSVLNFPKRISMGDSLFVYKTVFCTFSAEFFHQQVGDSDEFSNENSNEGSSEFFNSLSGEFSMNFSTLFPPTPI